MLISQHTKIPKINFKVPRKKLFNYNLHIKLHSVEVTVIELKVKNKSHKQKQKITIIIVKLSKYNKTLKKNTKNY
jgi:hypothetical protein